MRPIKLKMQAFGAYVKPVELNFESGLAGKKFFLIHGATGSGKTTILDAICYALYNRSSGDDRKVENLRSELADNNSNTEVEFIFALGDKIYKIFRNPGHKNPHGTANIKKSATLYIDDKFISDDVKEIDELIKSRMGFNAEQFRQVVMLPQGKFRDFLMASSNDKMKILNVIFNSALYERIEVGLKEKSEFFTVEKNKLDNLRENIFHQVREIGEVEGEINLSALIEKISAEFTESEKKLRELKILSDKAREDFTAGKILSEKFSQYESAEKNLVIARNNLEKILSDYEKAKVEYELRKSEESLRLELDKKIDELKKIQSEILEYQNKKSELARAESAEKSAREEISRCESNQKKYADRMAVLKAEIEKLQGADVQFKVAEQNLEKSSQKQKLLLELERLNKEIVRAQKNLAIAEKNLSDAQKELNRLRYLEKICTAAKLAQNLSDNEPCPVCGAIIHPKLAITDEIIPSDEEIETAEQTLKRCETARNLSLQGVNSVSDKINFYNDEIKKFVGVKSIEEAKKIFDDAKKLADKLADSKTHFKSGEEHVERNNRELEVARKNFETATKNFANLRGVVETMQKNISAEYLTAPEKILEDLRNNQNQKKILESAWIIADKNFHMQSDRKSKQEGEIKSAESTKNLAAEKISNQFKPDLIALKKSAEDSQEIFITQNNRVNNLNENLKRLNKFSDELIELDKKISVAEKNYQIWTRLYDVASGKNPAKMTFQTYYLNAMFQDVIREANERLEKMSGGRYQFRDMQGVKKGFKKAGLDLEILDSYTGKARPVETLSGGESFLASLSLALGLAAVVKNTAGGIKLDTIFIDEGFGSLDSETLDFAINALTELQTDSGRLVGIISHVEELKNRIPARLEVIKIKLGSTAKFI